MSEKNAGQWFEAYSDSTGEQTMQKLLPPALVAICVLIMTALHLLVPLGVLIDRPLLAVIVALTGLGFTLSGARLFSRVGTNIKTFNKPDHLVTSGLFRFTRNPMYLGFALLLVGFAIGLGTATPFIVVAAFFVITNLWYIPYEEKKMEETFGAAYLEYKARTRRWI
jgi:protein-S-isoprenylcysteine O-methyltransferase Ste14